MSVDMKRMEEIDAIEDLAPGDMFYGTYEGGAFSAELRSDPDPYEASSYLLGAGLVIRDDYGTLGAGVTFERAERELPPLPTEPGAVIANVFVRGEGAYEWATLTKEGPNTQWIGVRNGVGDRIAPEDILFFRLAKVVSL